MLSLASDYYISCFMKPDLNRSISSEHDQKAARAGSLKTMK